MTETSRHPPSEAPSPRRQLIYVADPMCSWCYGFSPVIAAIADRLGAAVPLRVVMGGLQAGNTLPMRDKDRDYIRSAWARVHEASGQPFDERFLERESFVYDTEPACRAVVTVRHSFPDDALPFLARISRAFYAENRDMTAPEAIADVAAEAGYNRDQFLAAFRSEHARQATLRDFVVAHEAGIRGFPTLLAGSDAEGYMVVTNGYCRLEDIEGPLIAWASGSPEAAPSA